MIETETVFTQEMILETKRVLCPFEKYTLWWIALDYVFSLRESSPDSFVVVAFTQVIVTSTLRPFFYGLHFSYKIGV